jgi:hypothetical protein
MVKYSLVEELQLLNHSELYTFNLSLLDTGYFIWDCSG